MSDSASMHIDGASRGNPGRAAYAVVLARPGQPVVEEAEVIGTASNNVAEYTALVEGLRLAEELGVKRLSVFSDSELMVKQMNGVYRVKNPELLQLYQEAKRGAAKLENVIITHVRREQNSRADALCNLALDGKLRTESPASTAQGEVAEHSPRAASASDTAPSDARVRDDALAILESAAQAWSNGGPGALPVEYVWEQLWSILEEGGVLKKPKKR